MFSAFLFILSLYLKIFNIFLFYFFNLFLSPRLLLLKYSSVVCGSKKKERGGGRASFLFSCLPERLADCCRSAFATIIVHQRARAVGVCRIISSTILFIGFALYYIYIYIISKEAGGKSRENNESEIFASASLPALPHRQASKGALRGLQEESEA